MNSLAHSSAEGGASIPTEGEAAPVLDLPGLTVSLVPDPVNGGMHIRHWTSDGLEPGTHRLIPACLAEREVTDLRDALVRLNDTIDDMWNDTDRQSRWALHAHRISKAQRACAGVLHRQLGATK